MGERFAGRYELVDHLGEGGSGSVWRAWDVKTSRYVAAKLLRQRDAEALLRFVREQSMRVAHPHVIAPHGWAAEDDDVLLTMELVAGGSVATLLADYGSIPLPMTLVLVDQLLDALAAVHAAGLVHRDVKPANLLLEPTGTGPPFLRLADFGIAVALDDPRLTATGMVVGTPGYVAPEVMSGAAPDLRQDLWCVAILARHLLTGVRPASTPGGRPLGAQAQAPLPVSVPAEALAWLDALSAPSPEDRPAGAVEARSALRRLDCWKLPRWQPEEEPLEVFDHLAALPPGWGPGGPVARQTSFGKPSLFAGGVGRAPVGQQAPTLREPPPLRLAVPAAPRPAPKARSGPSLGRIVQLVSAAVLAGTAVVAFVLASQGPDEASPGAPADQDEQEQPGPAGTAEAGDLCPFSQFGQRRTAPDGAAITCVLRNGQYVWR